MDAAGPDQMVMLDDWSELARIKEMPAIDFDLLHAWRTSRLKRSIADAGAAMALLVSPISMRYAVDYRTFPLFQSHIPTTYLFVPQAEGPAALFNGYGKPRGACESRIGRPSTFFDAGSELADGARLIAEDVVTYLSELGTDNRRVAVEYVNPSLTQALLQRGLEVIDGTPVAEAARVIKSPDEVACIRWACEVAEHGIAKMKQALKSGITELQLWGLLNYTNLANNGDWHEGRMLASGPRINPWLQEATDRRICSGDLVGFDTDMIGPFGYCADISRTFHCGPARPTRRQKELYRLALDEIEHNLALIRPGITFKAFQAQAYMPAEEFHENAYVCVIHAVGMCDEYPRINPRFRGPTPYDGTIEAGMVICVESYMGAVGERDGVKLEQQVLVTDDGYELLSSYPLEEELLN